MSKHEGKSPYARGNKTPFKYPDRQREVCKCGGIIFKGLNDGSPGAVMRHKCRTRRRQMEDELDAIQQL